MYRFDGDPDGDGQGHEIHTLDISTITELQEAYVKKVVDAVNDLDNVLYEVANEDHGGATEWQYHIIDFIMDLIDMVPRNDLASSGYCLANPGKEYLIYLPNGGEVVVDLSTVSGTFAVEWFNPETGEAISSEAIDGGKSEKLVTPFDGDAVLYILKPT